MELRTDTINNISIVVPDTLGKLILRDKSMLFHSGSKPDFRSYFKGLYFQLIATDPVFLTLSVAPATSSYSNFFYIYMHDQNGTPLTPFLLVLDAVSKNAAFNKYIHNWDAAEPDKKILHINDTAYLDSLTYVQRMNGVYTKVEIPGLRAIKKDPAMQKIAVNKARLIFPVYYDGAVFKRSNIPGQAYMRYVSKPGVKNIVPDYYISPAFFDGAADTINDVYRVNLASFVQSYLEDKTNTLKPELELFVPATTSNNLVLKANTSHKPVRFEFTYTRF
jgi:hypothetical protein